MPHSDRELLELLTSLRDLLTSEPHLMVERPERGGLYAIVCAVLRSETRPPVAAKTLRTRASVDRIVLGARDRSHPASLYSEGSLRPFCSVNGTAVPWFKTNEKPFLVLVRLAVQLLHKQKPDVNVQVGLCDSSAQDIDRLRKQAFVGVTFLHLDPVEMFKSSGNKTYRLEAPTEGVEVCEDEIARYVPGVVATLENKLQAIADVQAQEPSGKQFERLRAACRGLQRAFLRFKNQRTLLFDSCDILGVRHREAERIDGALNGAVALMGQAEIRDILSGAA